MKKLFLIMMMTLTVTGMTSCSAKGTKKSLEKGMITPDSVAYQALGKSLSEILFSPTKVNVYSLKAKDRVGKNDVEVEDHIVRDSLIATLSKEEIAILQYILLSDGESYKNDSIIVRSPYVPVIEFEFVKKKAEAQIVVSLSDRTWTLFYDDKKQFNWNFADKKAVIRFCKHYLNQIKNKEK